MQLNGITLRLRKTTRNEKRKTTDYGARKKGRRDQGRRFDALL